jgi:hypothetical protein
VDPHFGNAFSDWSAIAEVPCLGHIQSRHDSSDSPLVLETRKPRLEPIRFDKFNHVILYPYGYSVNLKSVAGKCMSPKSAQRFWDNDMHK